MNIFATSPCPVESARFLDDKRVNKMILESAQMMATHYRIEKGFKAKIIQWSPKKSRYFIVDYDYVVDSDVKIEEGVYKIGPVYKVSHKNHPCSLWVRSTRANYDWLFEHYISLIFEYHSRSGGKDHKTDRTMTPYLREFYTGNSPRHEAFVNCSTYKNEEVHQAYRMTLFDKWDSDSQPPKWNGLTA